MNDFANIVDKAWVKNSKIINITKHLKSWWDEKCSKDLEKYRRLKSLEDQKSFHSTVKSMKQVFFDLKIQKIENKKQDPWELMNLVNKCKLPAIETLKYNSQPCLELDDLWQALYLSFNTAQFHYIDENVLNEIRSFTSTFWKQFLEEELTSALTKYDNLSAPGLDKLLWRYLKCILKGKLYLKNIIKIANMCIEVGYQSTHFKT